MEHHSHRRRSSGSFLAWVLIIFGAVLILKEIGWEFNIPGFGAIFHGFWEFVGDVFRFIGNIGWPIILVIAGIVLIAGRRLFGALLLLLVLFFILPKFIVIPGILMILFFPVILLIAGIVILTKLF